MYCDYLPMGLQTTCIPCAIMCRWSYVNSCWTCSTWAHNYISWQTVLMIPDDVCVYSTPPHYIYSWLLFPLVINYTLSALTVILNPAANAEYVISVVCYILAIWIQNAYMVSTVYSEISLCYNCSIPHRCTCIEQRNRHEGEDSARRAHGCTVMSGHATLMYTAKRHNAQTQVHDLHK